MLAKSDTVTAMAMARCGPVWTGGADVPLPLAVLFQPGNQSRQLVLMSTEFPMTANSVSFYMPSIFIAAAVIFKIKYQNTPVVILALLVKDGKKYFFLIRHGKLYLSSNSAKNDSKAYAELIEE